MNNEFELYYEIIESKHTKNNEYIIFLHGFMFSEIWERTDFFKFFIKKGYICIKIDLLGFGKSPKPANIEYTIEDHVNSVIFTLKKILCEKKYILYGIGYSTGSVILLNLLTKNIFKFHKCAIISVPYSHDYNCDKKLQMIYSCLEKSRFDNLFNLSKIITQMIPDKNEFLSEFINNESYSSKKTLINIIKKQNITSFKKTLDNINVKILWIHPLKDIFIPNWYVDIIEKKYIHILQCIKIDETHYITKKNNEQISNLVINFIEYH